MSHGFSGSQFTNSGAGGAATQLDADGTILDVNVIADGQFLKRVGTTVVGASSSAGPASQLDADGTTLDVNVITDGQFLKRVGTTVVSAVPTLSLTTVEKDLGSTAQYSGRFDITGLSGLTASAQAMIVQKAGPYTGKGTLQDEAEMDSVQVAGYVVDATTIRGHWVSRGPIVGNVAFGYVVSS